MFYSWVFTKRFSREGKHLLSNDPSIRTSFFHSSSITLQDLFKEENTATSSGCRCVAFSGNIMKWTLFCSAALTTSGLPLLKYSFLLWLYDIFYSMLRTLWHFSLFFDILWQKWLKNSPIRHQNEAKTSRKYAEKAKNKKHKHLLKI